MNHEEFASQRAAEGWSQQNVADALGLSRYKLRLWLENIPPISWPKPWESKNAKAAVQRLNASREGIYPEQFRRTAEKSLSTRRKNIQLRRETHPDGEPGTLNELARRSGVSAESVRYWKNQGFRLKDALACAIQAKERYSRTYTAFGVTASLSSLVEQFGVVTRNAVALRMRNGVPLEKALTLPAQHLKPKDDHFWKFQDKMMFNEFASRNPDRFRRQLEAS